MTETTRVIPKKADEESFNELHYLVTQEFLRLIRSEYLVDAKGLNLVRGRPIGAATIVEAVNKTLG